MVVLVDDTSTSPVFLNDSIFLVRHLFNYVSRTWKNYYVKSILKNLNQIISFYIFSTSTLKKRQLNINTWVRSIEVELLNSFLFFCLPKASGAILDWRARYCKPHSNVKCRCRFARTSIFLKINLLILADNKKPIGPFGFGAV